MNILIKYQRLVAYLIQIYILVFIKVPTFYDERFSVTKPFCWGIQWVSLRHTFSVLEKNFLIVKLYFIVVQA